MYIEVHQVGGYTKEDIPWHEVITIKVYENLEHTSKGTILLPIKLGPAIQETICHVVDLDVPYKILLGHPWIHSIKAIASLHHQCIKFPHKGTKITIYVDPQPFTYWCVLEASFPHSSHYFGICIDTSIASSSRSHCNQATILASTLSTIKIKNRGYMEYILINSFVVRALPLDPHTQGCPSYQSTPQQEEPKIKKIGSSTFMSRDIMNNQEMDPTWIDGYTKIPHLPTLNSSSTSKVNTPYHTNGPQNNGIIRAMV